MGTETKRLGVGIVGSGFMAQFHIKSWVGVRDADIVAVWSRTRDHAESARVLCEDLGVGDPQVYTEVKKLARDPEVDAVWLVVPNFVRLSMTEQIIEEVQLGNAELIGIACEKPLAKNVREAREMVKLVKGTNLIHGYLENQVFAPAIVKGKKLMWGRGAKASGRPYLARAAEEHSGPHSSWFWSGVKQGGGALNDMLCHSLEAARFLLTEPERHRDSIQIESVNANTGFLKWTRPEYIEQLKKNTDGKVDYSKSPSEDYASANLRLTTETGQPAVIEATSSWCFTGSGLRINFELLGPEYSMKINSLNTDLQVFLGREVQGEEGEDMIEKQNAEQGSMPVLTNEAETYGYIAENRHMVEHFLDGTPPREDWEDGLEVIQLLMASYMSAESGRELPFPPDGLEEFIPAVAKK